jgi:hypothetical protein
VDPQRIGSEAKAVPLLQHRVRERSGVAADRRLGAVSTLLERPPCIALGAVPVGREDACLEDRDRPAPAARRRIGPALAIAIARAIEPLACLSRMSLHDERQTRPGRRVAHARQLALAGVGIIEIGKAGLTVAVPFHLAPEVLRPVSHGAIVMEISRHDRNHSCPPGRLQTLRMPASSVAPIAQLSRLPASLACSVFTGQTGTRSRS